MTDVAGGNLRGEAASPGLVSVMVPAFNAESTIVDTLDSVWTQTYRPIELIIVNDGSTDGTRDMIARWAEAHQVSDFTIVVIDQENQGLIKSRARGLSVSRGEYLQFLDADDLLHAEKLAVVSPDWGRRWQMSSSRELRSL